MNQSKVDDAVACFKSGFNCAQAVFSTYCERFGLDKNAGLKIASGLGGGMGRLQETCGAVTGAFLVIGMKHGSDVAGDVSSKEKTYAAVREFSRLFELRNKTTNCRELLGVDLINGDQPMASEQIKTVCPKMVRDAAEILESMIFQEG